MSGRKRTKLVREKEYAAEVTVDLVETPDAWGPHLSLEDAEKLDAVRVALREGDLATAQKYGHVYRLTPVSAA